MSYNPNQPRQAGRFAETATPAEQRASAPPPAAPVTVTCEHDKPAGKTLCPGCWYSGAVLAANMADTITELNTATGLDWKPEHTGGGCFWLTAQRNGVAVAIVTADGPFAGDDTIDAVTESGGWMIGAYDLEGDPLHDSEADDIAGIIDYCNQVIPTCDVTDQLNNEFAGHECRYVTRNADGSLTYGTHPQLAPAAAAAAVLHRAPEMDRSRPWASAAARQASLATRLAALNRQRLALAVDISLPDGVVRCVDCGRFVSESEMAHDCPFPMLRAAGFSDRLARELATAGFDNADEARTWRRMIERVGPERAGLWKATGVSPIDARRLDDTGDDPSGYYATGEIPKVETLADKRQTAAVSINGWIDQLAAGDPAAAASASDTVAQIVAFGDEVAGEIDRRYERAKAALLSEAWTTLTDDGRLAEDAVRFVMRDGLQGAAKLYKDTYGQGTLFYRLEEFAERERMLRADVTLETLSELRPFGGDLRTDHSAQARPFIEHAAARYPTSWVQTSAEHPHRLKVALRSKNRAGYTHLSNRAVVESTTPNGVKETSGWMTFSYGSRHRVMQSDIDRALRKYHPEAFDQAAYDRKGRSKNAKDRLAGRVSNIRNVQYDPATGRLTYDYDRERSISDDDRTPISLITTSNDNRAAVHELGHRMENTVPGLQTLAQTWRDQRCKDGKRVRVGSRLDEWGITGDFVNDYVGKVYASGDTEVLSVGIEAVFGSGMYGGLVGDPTYSYGRQPEADHDHRAFILGILATVGKD